MLFFIGYGGNNNGTANKFKYISCYSLSGQTTIHAYADDDLNTSHVILYR